MLSAIFLKGFKTFARPVRMPLSGGITAVVGPNGSGKSNITDAVLFALGEGSLSLLRAGAIDDVLFSGSETLAAANAAEVTLVLDNAGGEISLPYREVSLTRRVSRGGETEYRINGVRSRLTDVRAVAGEAGLGRHSILRQGAVDAIVAGGAAACRAALEEAAGLGVFRRRRQTAGRRLERAASQLESSRQLEAEISEQLRRIEAEAAAAREYREVEARYRKLSLAHLYRAATRDLDGLRERLAQAEWKAGELADREGSLREEGRRLGAEEQEAEGVVREAERRVEGLESWLESLRVQALRAERTSLRFEGGQDRDADRRRAIPRLRAELERVSENMGRLEGEAGELEDEHSRAKEELGRLEVAVERGRGRLAAAAAQRARAAEEMETLRARRGRAEARLADEDAALGEGEISALARAGERLAALSPERLRERSAAALGRAGELRDAAMRLGTEGDRRGGALAALVGRAEAEVRALRAPGGPGKRLYEVVRARPGYEAAVEAALGELAGGVLARTLGEGIQYLTGEGPAERVVVRLDAERLPDGASPGKPLVECVEVLDDRYEEAVSRLLGGVYVLDELPEAEASPRNGHVAVTRGGLRLTRTSASRRGVVEGDFAREARLALWEGRLDELKNGLGEELYDLRETARAVLQRLEELSAGVEALGTGASRVMRVTQSLVREAEIRARRSGRARAARAEIESSLAALRARTSPAEEELRAAEEAEEKAKESLSGAAALVEPAYVASREAAGRVAQASAALSEDRAREAALSRRSRRLENVAGQDPAARLAGLARRAAEAPRRIDEAARDRLAAARRMRSQAAERRGLVAGRRAQLAGETGELAGEVARARSKAEALGGELARDEDAVSGAEVELFEEWGATLETAREEAEALAEDGNVERARLARRLKSFGDVNLLAISQEGSLRERHDFVAAQRSDAEEAAAELERMIQDIDAEIAARFEGVFGRVRRAFERIVPRMMEGAAGELQLSEEGVEIGLRLRRRGWRPLRVLSGGERALLALSFLFGIFLGREEPGSGAFCILDEAEAALDDVNLARFLSVVDSYRADGQFLLVTHQKRTMAAADVLYGVTPDATGASIVVSKRLTGD